MPPKEELMMLSIKEAAEKYGKSTRTIRRWLEKLQIYFPQEKYRPGKIDKSLATKIRRLDKAGWTQQKIAVHFEVSQPMVGKIINDLAHKITFCLGGEVNVSVAKNYMVATDTVAEGDKQGEID